MLIAIIVILGLSLLVFGHEAGHFLAAKFFGMRIEEFGFGFPPRLFGVRRYRRTGGGEEKWRSFWLNREARVAEEGYVPDGTIYSFNWLVIGGFVRIAGENDHVDESNERTLNAIPEDEKKKYFLFQPAWKRSVVLIAGVFMNVLIGWFLLSSVYLMGIPSVIVVGSVEPSSPAAAAGIQPNDAIRGYANAQDFINFVNANQGRELALSLLRNGRDITVKVSPRVNPPPDEGALGIGIGDAGVPRMGFFRALWEGLKDTWQILMLTFAGLWMLIENLVIHHSLVRGVVGPVGIFSIAEQTGSLGLAYVVRIVSLISVNLAVVNAIPFPALDGGRFLMVLVEKIKGSPVPLKVEMWINAAGFALLIVLMAFITFHDIAHLL